MRFSKDMDKQLHVTGIENTHENSVDTVVFNAYEYTKTEIL